MELDPKTIKQRTENKNKKSFWPADTFYKKEASPSPACLADTSRHIVVRSVAWAEPSLVFSSIGDRDASQMCADTKGNDPFRVLHTVAVLLWIAKSGQRNCIFDRNFFRASAADKNRLSSPFDGHGLPHSNLVKRYVTQQQKTRNDA